MLQSFRQSLTVFVQHCEDCGVNYPSCLEETSRLGPSPALPRGDLGGPAKVLGCTAMRDVEIGGAHHDGIGPVKLGLRRTIRLICNRGRILAVIKTESGKPQSMTLRVLVGLVQRAEETANRRSGYWINP